MEYRFDNLFSWSSGKAITPTDGVIPIYGSNGIIGYTDNAKYKNKIILGRVGAYCGSVEYCADEFNATDNTLITTCDTSKIQYFFAYYLLKQYNLNGLAGGAAQPLITQGLLKHLKCNIPCLETQSRISKILQHYDSLIEANNKRIKILEQMAENLYKEWFVRFRFPGHETAEFENGLPKGWEYKRLFDVANVKYGYSFSSDDFCEDAQLKAVVRIRDIPNNQTKTYTSEICDEQYYIEENSILVGMDGIFHMCLWNGGRAYLNQRVVKITSKYENMCNYLLLLSIAPQIKFWEQTIAGTTVAHLGDKHLRKMVVLVPTENVLKQANAIIYNLMRQKTALMKSNQNLIKQRDLLLPRLMSGKLEV